jgi:hypothetical protein
LNKNYFLSDIVILKNVVFLIHVNKQKQDVMRNLETFFENPFDDDKISDERKNSFARDHINRTTDNNPGGRYTPMITATQTVYDGYFGKIVETGGSTALRKSKTITVEEVSQQIKKLLSSKEGVINDIWPRKSSVYTEFYPMGITEYWEATRDGILPLLDRFIDACGRHTGQLPTNFVDQFRELREAYDTARSEQQQKKGDVVDDKEAKVVARQALDSQLFQNLLQIAKDFAGNPSMLSAYFDQTIIRRRVSAVKGENGEEPEEIEPITGEVAPETIKEVMHGAFVVTTIFNLGNPGPVPVDYYTASKPDDPKPGTTVRVLPDEEVEVEASALGAGGNLYLMVFNPSKDTTGSYSCEAYNI